MRFQNSDVCRGDQLTIRISRITEPTLKIKRETRVNVFEHATATAIQFAITSCCEHIYDRSYVTILKNRTST